jgi:hypothetical protein
MMLGGRVGIDLPRGGMGHSIKHTGGEVDKNNPLTPPYTNVIIILLE